MNSVNATSLILISIGSFFFFTKPMLADLSSLSDKKADYEEALEKLNSIEEIKNSLQQKLDSLSPEDKNKIETMLPTNPNMVKLVSDIDASARKQGINIDQISYSPRNTDNANSVAEAPAAKPYQSTTLNFSFSADYNHLKDFLSDLEGSLRLIDIRGINLLPGEKGKYSYTVSAEVYSLNSESTKQP